MTGGWSPRRRKSRQSSVQLGTQHDEMLSASRRTSEARKALGFLSPPPPDPESRLPAIECNMDEEGLFGERPLSMVERELEQARNDSVSESVERCDNVEQETA